MKYCEKCCSICVNDDACTCSNNKLLDLNPDSAVKVATVKGNLKAIVEPALKDKGIPCQFFNPEMDVYNQYNPKVNAETEYSLLVPFELYSEAFEVCVGLGLAEPEDKIEVEESTQISCDESYEAKFEEVTGTKRASFRILWIILFIVVACLVIWGVDLIAALIKGEIYDIPFINFL